MHTSRSSDGEKSGNFTWSNDGQKFEVNYRGDFEFSADDTDVSRLSPGGYLRIKDGRRLGTDNSIEFRANSSGAIERRFWVSGQERPFDPEGRKWLAEVLPKFIRQSGIGARARVARFMKSGGAPAVLAEISRIEGSWAKRLYFTELFKQPGLSGAVIQQALGQAGREIDSDFELASLLIGSNQLITDDAARRAYLDAARTIGSDFELRRVLSSIVKAGPMTSAIAAAVLDTSGSIESAFERASLLSEFVARQPLDGTVAPAFFKALSGVSSAFEHNRVLKALLTRTDLSEQARVAALESSAAVDSDFEAATFLVQDTKTSGVAGCGARAVLPRRGVDRLVVRARPRAAGAVAAVGPVRADRARDHPLGAERELEPRAVAGVARRRRKSSAHARRPRRLHRRVREAWRLEQGRVLVGVGEKRAAEVRRGSRVRGFAGAVAIEAGGIAELPARCLDFAQPANDSPPPNPRTRDPEPRSRDYSSVRAFSNATSSPVRARGRRGAGWLRRRAGR